MGSFFSARQDLRAQTGLALEERRLELAKSADARQQESFDYDKTLRPIREQGMHLDLAAAGQRLAAGSQALERNEYLKSLRPLEEQRAQLGLAAAGLDIATASQRLQMGQLDLSSRTQVKAMIDGILRENVAAAQPQNLDLLSRVKQFEKFNPKPYKDFKQTSIGYGTRAKEGDVELDESTATKRLRDELSSHAARVDKFALDAGVTLSQNQRDALISFDFNTGSAKRLLEKAGGDMSKIPSLMQEWRNAGGQVSPGLVKRRKQEAEWFLGSDDSSAKTATYITSRPAPSGAPVYAEAAASASPADVIDSTFSDRAGSAFKRYDALKILAQTAPDQEDRMQATMGLNSMEQNPEFQAALGERNLLLTAAANQAAINASIMGSRQDFFSGFQQLYPQYSFQATGTQIIPFNSLTGQPLNPQEQASFQAAWMQHQKTFDPSMLGGIRPGDGLFREYNRAWGNYNAGRELIGRTNLPEDESRRRDMAVSALGQIKAFEQQYPMHFGMLRQELASRPPPPPPGGEQQPPPEVDTTNMTVEDLRKRKAMQENDALQSERLLNVAATMNTLAAELAQNEGLEGMSSINIANEIIAGKPKPTGESRREQYYEGGMAFERFADKTVSPAEYYADITKLPVADVKAWAKSVVDARKKASIAGDDEARKRRLEKLEGM